MAAPNDESAIEEVAGASTSGNAEDEEPQSAEDRKLLFQREIRNMMIGFGDHKNPREDSLQLMESIVINYIHDLCRAAMTVGRTDKISIEDVYYLVRRDARRFGRVKDLLSLSEELKKARKQFEDMQA